MVDAVNILSSQGTPLSSSSQSVGAVSAAAPTQRVTPNDAFVSGRVRVDNLQNVAILEYRSSEGEVVRQYPTQSQINAFRSAESLQSKARPAPQPQEGVSSPEVQAAAPSVGESAAPVVQAPAAGSGDTHSVVV